MLIWATTKVSVSPSSLCFPYLFHHSLEMDDDGESRCAFSEKKQRLSIRRKHSTYIEYRTLALDFHMYSKCFSYS